MITKPTHARGIPVPDCQLNNLGILITHIIIKAVNCTCIFGSLSHLYQCLTTGWDTPCCSVDSNMTARGNACLFWLSARLGSLSESIIKYHIISY